jgi:hypothetical protein
MYRLDDSLFPIMVQSMDDVPLSVEMMERFDRQLVAAFERETPFAILALITSETDIKPQKEVTRYSNAMFKRLKPLFSRWCVGYAYVTQVTKWLKLYKPIAGTVIRNRMGCDGAVFEHEQDARAWLNEQLRERTANSAVAS